MSEQNNQKTKSLRKKLFERYGEVSVFGNRETVVLHGVSGATVYGCRRIVCYSPREIRLQLQGRTVSVCGSGLFCASFTGGTVQVKGCVSGVVFGESKREGTDADKV